MSESPIRSSSSQISLEELTALCDEMVALSRAGVPLDRGLIELAEDLPGRLGAKAQRIGEQLAGGGSLADVVSAEDSPFPRVYRSVVESGLRSGRLTVALEGISRLARQMSEVRRIVISALIYPLILLVVLITVSLGVLTQFGPTVRDSLISLSGRGASMGSLRPLMDGYVIWSQWFWLLPTGLLVLGVVWLCLAQGSSGSDWASWIPGVGTLLRNSRLQVFSRVLSLLVQQRVPLHEAVRLAGNASGDRHLLVDAEDLADEIEKGTKSSSGNLPKRNRGIPPFMRWSLLHCEHVSKLETSLQNAAHSYERRTNAAADWLRRTLPIIFSVSLGGIVSLMYAATVFVPWYAMLQSLSTTLENM